MPVEARAIDCTCGERILATNDQTLGKAIKDHLAANHDGETIELEDAVKMAETDGFNPQDGEGNIDLTISR